MTFTEWFEKNYESIDSADLNHVNEMRECWNAAQETCSELLRDIRDWDLQQIIRTGSTTLPSPLRKRIQVTIGE